VDLDRCEDSILLIVGSSEGRGKIDVVYEFTNVQLQLD